MAMGNFLASTRHTASHTFYGGGASVILFWGGREQAAACVTMRIVVSTMVFVKFQGQKMGELR